MKRTLSIALCVLGMAGVAQATPGAGVTPSNRVVSAATAIEPHLTGNGLLLKVGSDKAPIDILNITQTFAPGGFSGWHTHSGPGFVIVVQGTLTVEETEGCFVDFPQGSVLYEGGPSHIHNALNRTSSNVVLDAYFFLPAVTPAGSNSRIDEPVQYGACE